MFFRVILYKKITINIADGYLWRFENEYKGNIWCRKPDLNRHERLSSRDFKSRASANFAIPAAIGSIADNSLKVKHIF